MPTFNLPDLGEGLPEAEIVNWHVNEGDVVAVDDSLVSVETAKAVVEVPSPHAGKIEKLHAAAGDIVKTGSPLVSFADAGSAAAPGSDAADAATVVGNVPTSNELLVEKAVAGSKRKRKKQSRIKATPSVRALATRLGIDLNLVGPTGKNGNVTPEDVKRFQATGSGSSVKPPAPQHVSLSPGASIPLRGPRRAMANSMSMTRDEVAVCTLFDDADIHDWVNKRDYTPRMLRAISIACRVEPALNGFFDADNLVLTTEARVDIAMAVDTDDGLIVPVIRNCETMDLPALRRATKNIAAAARARSIPPQDMVNYTFTLSNFGAMAGRYGTPLMVPPTVGILGSGRIQNDVVAVLGGIEVHRRIPLSLSFDHRCVTGGEACRFLAAVIQDLQRPE